MPSNTPLEEDIPVSPTTPVKSYHSTVEKNLVESILKVNLEEVERELDNRIIVQHVDSRTNIEVFNMFSKKVLIKDENGKRVIIDNFDELRRQRLKNVGKLNPPEPVKVIVDNSQNSSSSDDFEFDD